MARWFSFLWGLFAPRTAQVGDRGKEAYSGLREMALTMTPGKLGVTPTTPGEVWGVLMETGYPEAVATLVALAGGTVSLYFSNGGGIIGIGPHPGPKRAADSLLAFSQQFVKEMQPTTSFPLPQVGFTRFYLLTVNGARTAMAKEDDLGYGRHLLSPLFHKGHELLAEVRKVDKQLREQRDQPHGSG